MHRLSHGANRPGDPAAAPLLTAFLTAGLEAALTAADPNHHQETPP